MFDLEKAIICVSKMKTYFDINEGTANVQIPSELLFGSNEHIVFIFYSCLLDYGMRSKIYHANLVNTYKKFKNIFNPKYVVNNFVDNEIELFNIIKDNIHPRYPNVALKKWISLSKYLNDNFSQNELKDKIVSLKSYSELYNFITSINGYGQKTGGLLLRLIYESGICNFDDELNDIPIDRHDVEISYLNGIVDREKLSNQEMKKLGDVWIKAAKSNGVSACNIDKYLWSLGNELCLKKRCNECPIKDGCKTKIYSVKGEKNETKVSKN